ncbi:MAG: hypothetical protein OFPI_28640 [Osedax symbiont Rs2]|nr:MAG: hypothetical protein OFPI_28640 [Osedax symbiont Rs2]
MLGRIAAAWGLIGVFLFLASAIYKLAIISWQLLALELELYHWLAIVIWVVFMGYYEGYQGFQKGFSPRVAARIHFLVQNVTYKRLVLAPLFCLGFFDAERRRIIFIICLSLGIVLLVKAVEHMPMPWRGIMDVGVVVGLSWGLISMLIFTAKAFYCSSFNHSAEVPHRELDTATSK